jgi:hypothetical protein
VEEEGGADKIESEVMMRFLGKTPGWGEKNFQVRTAPVVWQSRVKLTSRRSRPSYIKSWR